MDDLISRQAAIDALKEHRALYCDNTPITFLKLSYAEKSRVDELDTSIATLVNLPSEDAVRVVLCKDCRFHEQEQPGMVYCPDTVGGWVEENWFCKGGERRTE